MPKKVLIVEDNKQLVETYRRVLTRTGYEVIYAYNGKDGLERLKEVSVDLIILDLKMPKMSGDKFLKVLRKDPELKDTKVLVMSSVLSKHKKVMNELFTLRDTIVPTRIARKAKKYGQKEGKFEIEAKKERRVDFYFGELIDESDAEFRRRIIVGLVEKVKELIGEPEKREIPPVEEIKASELEERAKDIIAKKLKAKRQELTLDASFSKDLGLDNLTFALDLVIDLENEFNVEIDDETIESIKTVGELIEHIKKKLKDKGIDSSA